MIAVDLANAVFLICLVVAGLFLLVGLLFDDEIGPVLDFLQLRRAVRGVPIVGYVLAFVCGFGIGGLVGTSGMNAEALPAAGLGVVGGLLGLVLARVLGDARKGRRAMVDPKIDLEDLVGHRGRVSSPIRDRALGTVSLRYHGDEREFAATAATEIPIGSPVVVDDVDERSSTLVVTLARNITD